MTEINFKKKLFIDCLSWYFPIQSYPIAYHTDTLRTSGINEKFKEFYTSYEEISRADESIKFNFHNEQLRALSMQRPKSASQATKIAYVLFNYLLKNNYCSEPLALFTLSLTSVPGIAYEYEKFALEHGWDLIDPFWLPNSIHTSISTHLARLAGNVKIAHAFIGDIDALFAAIESAYYYLNTDGIKKVVIICSEQINPPQEDVYKILGGKSFLMEGSSAIILSSDNTKNSKSAIRSLRFGKGSPSIIPDIVVNITEPINYFNCLSFPLILAREIATQREFISLTYKRNNDNYLSIQFEN